MRVIFLALTLMFLVGCSSQLGYRFADTIIAWQIDDYVSLDGELEDAVEEDIQELHLWHARSELPRYRKTLLEIRKLTAAEELTVEQLDSIRDDGWYFWERVRLQVSPYAQELLPQLSDAQVEELLGNLQEQLDERKERSAERKEERAELSEEEYLEESTEEVAEEIREWTGRLTQRQFDYISEWVAKEIAANNDKPLWLDYRQAWLDEFAEVLRAGPEASDYSERLERLIQQPEHWRSSELRKENQRNQTANLELIITIHKLMTEKQRERILSKIDAYLEDLDGMIEHFAEE